MAGLGGGIVTDALDGVIYLADFAFALVHIVHGINRHRGILVTSLRPNVYKLAAVAHAIESIEIAGRIKGRSQRLVAIGGIDFINIQRAQIAVVAEGDNVHGVGAGIIAKGDLDLGGGLAVHDLHGGGGALAVHGDGGTLAGGGGEAHTLGAAGNAHLIRHGAGGELGLERTHAAAQRREVSVVIGQSKDPAAVVAVIEGAVGAADGADEAELLVAGRAVDLGLDGVLAGTVSGIYGDEGNAAGLAVVGGIAVELAGVLQIGGGKHHRALGIRLHGDGVQAIEGVGIGHNDVAVAVAACHNAAAGAEDHKVTVHHGGGGSLKGNLAALQIGQGAALGIHCHGGNVAVFGGEIGSALLSAVGNGGALVAHAGKGDVGNDIAVLSVQSEEVGIAVIAACAVIATHDHSIAHHGGAGPVEAAGDGLLPNQRTIGGLDAHKVSVTGLALPVAGIQIAVGIGDGAVVLAAQLVGEGPLGLQRLGVKGLHLAAGDGAVDHAIGIGGRHDGIAAAVKHGGFLDKRTGLQIHFFQRIAGHEYQRIVGNDKAAGGGRPTAAVFLDPLFSGGFHGSRGGRIGDGHVIEAVAEVRPVVGVVSVSRRDEAHDHDKRQYKGQEFLFHSSHSFLLFPENRSGVLPQK